MCGNETLILKNISQIRKYLLEGAKWNCFITILCNWSDDVFYDKYGDCLGNASEHDFERSYIDYTKQKTVVSFDEDGTIVKSITFGNASGMDSYRGNGYQVNLNQPFVYCIKDRSGLPLVLGAVNNPIEK